MNHYVELIYLFLPVILAGIFNMIFVKLPFISFLKIPMDGGIILRDGRRLFGDNKTWKGFIGMMALTSLFMALQQQISVTFFTPGYFTIVDFNTTSGWFAGLVLGFGYAVAELPNSFIKRRINIAPGTNKKGFVGLLFTVLDQADSVVGCICAMVLFYTFTLGDVVFLLLFGTVLHYVLNVLLFVVKLKKQAA